jgi:hypothetical protein
MFQLVDASRETIFGDDGVVVIGQRQSARFFFDPSSKLDQDCIRSAVLPGIDVPRDCVRVRAGVSKHTRDVTIYAVDRRA